MHARIEQFKSGVKRYRKVLGIPGPLILVAFLFAETLKEIVFDVFPSPLTHVALLGVLGVGAVALAKRLTHQVAAPSDPLVGAIGNVKLAHRKAMVLLVGLDSAKAESAAVKALRHAPNLQHLVLVGTPETEQLGVEKQLVERILPALGREIPEANIVIRQRDSQAIQGTEEIVASELVRLIHGIGLKRAEIVVDVTAGRQEAVAGALEAAHRDKPQHSSEGGELPGSVIKVEAQIVSGRWDAQAQQTVPGTTSVKIVKEFYDDGLQETSELSGSDPLF